jgi:hypothetical protein
MRLTADVILRAQVSINPLRERELNLRGACVFPSVLLVPSQRVNHELWRRLQGPRRGEPGRNPGRLRLHRPLGQ